MSYYILRTPESLFDTTKDKLTARVSLWMSLDEDIEDQEYEAQK